MDEKSKDVEGLVNGKTKARLSHSDLERYYKFMCFYSDGEYSVNAVRHIVEKINREKGDILEIWHGQKVEKPERIYVFMVTQVDDRLKHAASNREHLFDFVKMGDSL
jgi:hypothetical protein